MTPWLPSFINVKQTAVQMQFNCWFVAGCRLLLETDEAYMLTNNCKVDVVIIHCNDHSSCNIMNSVLKCKNICPLFHLSYFKTMLSI